MHLSIAAAGTTPKSTALEALSQISMSNDSDLEAAPKPRRAAPTPTMSAVQAVETHHQPSVPFAADGEAQWAEFSDGLVTDRT